MWLRVNNKQLNKSSILEESACSMSRDHNLTAPKPKEFVLRQIIIDEFTIYKLKYIISQFIYRKMFPAGQRNLIELTKGKL